VFGGSTAAKRHKSLFVITSFSYCPHKGIAFLTTSTEWSEDICGKLNFGFILKCDRIDRIFMSI
jgi:hypothetical protein